MQKHGDIEGTVELYESVFHILVEALETISKAEGVSCRNRKCTQLRHDPLCPVRITTTALRRAREINERMPPLE